jgi:hypothetical protein
MVFGEAGTQPAALAFGSGPALTSTEEYNIATTIITAAAWAAGGNMNSTLTERAGAGTQTAGIVFGGEGPPGSPAPTKSNATELYNGTSWTTSPGTLNTRRQQLGSANAGSQTATLAFGGDGGAGDVTNSESWNGTAWTNTPSLNTARRDLSGFGIQTAAIAVGGTTPTPSLSTATESWNGTTWTSANNLGTARRGLAGVGLQTAGLAFGGSTGGNASNTESWNGTSWSPVNSLNIAANNIGGAGIQTSAIGFGGVSPVSPATTASTTWDGTSWVSAPNLGTGRSSIAGMGTQSAGLGAGGYSTTYTNLTEEFTGETTSNNYKTITTS